MIIKEFYLTRDDGVNLWRNYSSLGYQIRQLPTNIIYDEAIDVEGAPYTYEETTTPIPQDTETPEEREENERRAREILGIIVGSENE